MLFYQALNFAQLIVFQGGGPFQSLTGVRVFPAQSARLCLFRFAQSHTKPLYNSDGLPFIPLWQTSR